MWCEVFAMNLVDRLNLYPKDYWDFLSYKKDNPIVRYPATMVAPMQECILKEVIKDDNSIKSVLDPFVGSGTVLQEGQKLGLDLYGFDINPLAILITEVQLSQFSKDSKRKIYDLYNRITLLNGNVEDYTFNNIDKWFRKDIIRSLSLIREAIIRENDEQYRKFFWCCFAQTVKKYCNSRTSTFKLHIKEQEKIDNMIDSSIEFFKTHVMNQFEKILENNNTSKSKVDLRCGNSIDLLQESKSESYDLICTSPPYGDNSTTVTYGQYSILPLLWIDSKDLFLWDSKLTENFSAIDTMSLGGKKIKDDIGQYNEFVKNIKPEKQKKVISFFNDYENIFSNMVRVLKKNKLIILTLGNRRVDNQEIRFDIFNDFLAKKYHLELDSTITRNIIGKRMPSKVSSVKGVGAVSSMSTEYVKIYRKV